MVLHAPSEFAKHLAVNSIAADRDVLSLRRDDHIYGFYNDNDQRIVNLHSHDNTVLDVSGNSVFYNDIHVFDIMNLDLVLPGSNERIASFVPMKQSKLVSTASLQNLLYYYYSHDLHDTRRILVDVALDKCSTIVKEMNETVASNENMSINGNEFSTDFVSTYLNYSEKGSAATIDQTSSEFTQNLIELEQLLVAASTPDAVRETESEGASLEPQLSVVQLARGAAEPETTRPTNDTKKPKIISDVRLVPAARVTHEKKKQVSHRPNETSETPNGPAIGLAETPLERETEKKKKRVRLTKEERDQRLAALQLKKQEQEKKKREREEKKQLAQRAREERSRLAQEKKRLAQQRKRAPKQEPPTKRANNDNMKVYKSKEFISTEEDSDDDEDMKQKPMDTDDVEVMRSNENKVDKRDSSDDDEITTTKKENNDRSSESSSSSSSSSDDDDDEDSEKKTVLPISRSHDTNKQKIVKRTISSSSPSEDPNFDVMEPETPLPAELQTTETAISACEAVDKVRVMVKRATGSVKSIVKLSNILLGSGKPPKSITKFKISNSTRSFVHKPFPIKPKSTLSEYPEYKFYKDEYEPDLDRTITLNSCIDCFPEHANLMPLSEIVKDNPPLSEIKMIHTEVGEVLRKLTWARSRCTYTKKLMNDTRIYPIIYYLVYGAIPKQMRDAGLYFMKLLMRSYYDFDKDNHAPFISGEIEIMTYIYWNISSDDLLYWRDDVPRKSLKRLLAYAWSFLPDTTGSENDIKQKILDYAKFNIHDKISAECMLFIKYRYSKILMLVPKEHAHVWHHFMRSSKVHHYLCPYTVREIFSKMSATNAMLKAKYEDSIQENANTYEKMISRAEIAKLFKPKFIEADSHVTADLYKITNDLAVWSIVRLASKIIQLNLNVELSVITDRVISGIVSTFSDLTYNNVFVNRSLSSAISGKFSKFLIKMINLKSENSRSMKLSKDGSDALVEMVYMILSQSIGSAVFSDYKTGTKMSALLVESMQDYLDRNSTVVDMNSWIISNDDSSYEPETDESDSESDDDYCSDYSVDEEAGIEDRRASAFRKDDERFGAIESIKYQPIVKKTQRMSAKRAVDNGKYKYDESSISRTLCVLCQAMTTVKLLCLGDDTKVPTCNFCAYELNTKDYDLSKLMHRINSKVKAPLMFKIAENGEPRLLRSKEISEGLTQLSYNYVERAKQQEAYRMRKLEKEKRKAQQSAQGSPAKRSKLSKRGDAESNDDENH